MLRTWIGMMSFAVTTLAMSSLLADEPKQEAGLEQLTIRSTVSGSALSTLNGAVYSVGNQPLAAFGIAQLPDQKPAYTYFILFKPIKDKAAELVVNGPVRSGSYQTKYTLTINSGKRSFAASHHLALDRESKKISTDAFSVGDKPLKEGESRFLIVDLNADPPTWESIQQKLPAGALDPADSTHHLDHVRKLVQSLRESPDLRKLLQP